MTFKMNNNNNQYICDVKVFNLSNEHIYRDNGGEYINVGEVNYANLYIEINNANRSIQQIKYNKNFTLTNESIKLHNVILITIDTPKLIQNSKNNYYMFKIEFNKIELL